MRRLWRGRLLTSDRYRTRHPSPASRARQVPRVLLIAPHASYRTAPYIAAARRIGIEVAVVSSSPRAVVPAQWQGIAVDLEDRASALATLLAANAETPFSGVIGTDDATVELASRFAVAAGLRGNPPQAAARSRRKDLARAVLAEAGLPLPRWHLIEPGAGMRDLPGGLGFPCVAKPIALNASRGVIRADDRPALEQALARIVRLLEREEVPADERAILVEEYIPGDEVAVEGLLENGRLRPLTLFDKPEPLTGPYFEETYYTTPSVMPAGIAEAVIASLQAACAAFGLREGPVHGECRVNERGVWILEVASRTIGGQCGRLFRFGTGFGIEEVVLRHACGLEIGSGSMDGAAGVLMIPVPAAGILRRVEGIEAALRTPLIEELVIDARTGHELVPWPEGGSYPGFMFARGPDPRLVYEALRRAHRMLRFVVDPVLPVRAARHETAGFAEGARIWPGEDGERPPAGGL